MKPVIKWAGNKSQLVPILKLLAPENYSTYYEPFVGGGSLLLALAPKTAVIGDINKELINLYTQIKTNPLLFNAHVTALDSKRDKAVDQKAYYTSVVNLFNEHLGSNTPQQAARFVYLNKHCFNNIYRVNAAGEFNVMYSRAFTGKSNDDKNIKEIAELLSGHTIVSTDFEETVAKASAGDFVFFDGPDVGSDDTFSEADQRRLAEVFKQLSDRGVYCMLTSVENPLIKELYSAYKTLYVPIKPNAVSNYVLELVIINYETSYFDLFQKQLTAKYESIKKADDKLTAKPDELAIEETKAAEVAAESTANKAATATTKRKSTRKKKTTSKVAIKETVEVPVQEETAVVPTEETVAEPVPEQIVEELVDLKPEVTDAEVPAVGNEPVSETDAITPEKVEEENAASDATTAPAESESSEAVTEPKEPEASMSEPATEVTEVAEVPEEPVEEPATENVAE